MKSCISAGRNILANSLAILSSHHHLKNCRPLSASLMSHTKCPRVSGQNFRCSCVATAICSFVKSVRILGTNLTQIFDKTKDCTKVINIAHLNTLLDIRTLFSSFTVAVGLPLRSLSLSSILPLSLHLLRTIMTYLFAVLT